jgi:metal-responsive CopG/Arc/MetJ family transcriptional regulator
MENIKTAISIQKPLFDEAESLAHELEISRSGLFAIAIREFIHRHKNHKMLQSINAAYADVDDTEEESLSTQRRLKHFKMVKDQW